VVTDLAQLACRLDELEREQQALRDSRDQYKQLYLEMLERCRKLERGLLGQKAERLSPDDAQLSLAVLGELLSGRESAAELDLMREVKTHKRKKPTGRKPLPADLPRVEIEVVPPEVQRQGLDAFDRIGEEATEIVERRPASVVVVRVIKGKYALKGRDRANTEVFVGRTPELPIERGLAVPGMLADTLVRRWQDHLPLNRLEGIYAREGLPLSTMCGWHEQLAELVQPLIDAMRQDAFEAPYLCTDATGVLVQAKERCRRGHFWVMVVPDRHVLFEYTRDHSAASVDRVLSGYEGYLVADAHAVYDHLYEGGAVTEVNCWAHARRYFFKAMGSDPDRARFALGHIGALFKIERSLATAPRKKKERLRERHSKPVVDRFFSWCDAEWEHVLESTPIYDGIRYARNQRKGLVRFLEDGRLPLHNNLSEMNLRRQAIGRKNWLFVGSDEGAKTNAVFTSLLASCRMLGIEPWAYLRDLLCLLPRWPKHDVLELAPVHWPRTLERQDVQQRLADDPYRKATLAREP
jgi:transposase